MAIDKAIDSAVLDANLATVADAIRAKGGTSEPLSFPTGFAEAIAAIQAGGGGEGVFGEKSASGSFTLSSNAASFTFEHGLGKTPKYAIIFLGSEQKYSRTKALLIFAAAYASPSGDKQMCLYGKASGSDAAGYNISSNSIDSDSSNATALWFYACPIFDANETTISVGDATGSNALYLMANKPYYWIVW